jgi:hypothetical protein
MTERPTRRAQLVGSIVVGLAIVAVTIAVVTAMLGPTSTAELESLEQRQKERTERLEERLEHEERLREERD